MIAICIIGLFGIVMMVPRLSNWFAQKTGFIADAGSKIHGTSGFLVGAALGLVWTPCAGPILAAITTLVATQQVTFTVFLMTLAYSIGAGIPLLMIAYGGKKILNIPTIAKHTETIRQVFGGLMLLTAVALYFNWESSIISPNSISKNI
jgi:cytochrome c biogenesis protein CcdA